MGCYLITCRYLNDIPVYVYTYRSSQKKLQSRPGFLNTTFKLQGRWTPKKLFDHNFWKSRHMLSKFLLSQTIAKEAFHISVKEMMSKDTLVSDHNGNFYSMWKWAGLQPWGCSLVPSYFSSRLFHFFFFFFVTSVSIFLQTVIYRKDTCLGTFLCFSMFLFCWSFLNIFYFCHNVWRAWGFTTSIMFSLLGWKWISKLTFDRKGQLWQKVIILKLTLHYLR